MRERADRFYRETHKTLAQLAKQWRSEGLVDDDADPIAIADLFIALMPGLIVSHHLFRPPNVTRLIEGISVFAGSRD